MGRVLKNFAIFCLISTLEMARADILGNILPRWMGRSDHNRIPHPCTCGLFLREQLILSQNEVLYRERPKFTKEIKLPIGNCATRADKICSRKCTEMTLGMLGNLNSIMCASTKGDLFAEKAHLFYQNCDDEWRHSGFTPAAEFCCANGTATKCQITDTDKSVPDLLFDLADLAADVFNLKP